MNGHKKKFIFFQPKVSERLALVNLRRVIVHDFFDRIACYKNVLWRKSLAQQVVATPLRIRHEHATYVIDYAAVGLLRNAKVITTVTCFHVVYGNVHSAGNHRTKAAVRVSQNQQPVRAMFIKDGLDSGKDLADLIAVPHSSDPQENVRFSNFQFAKKKLTQPIIKVLASVHQQMFRVFVQEPCNQAEANNFWSRAEYRHYPQCSTSAVSLFMSSTMRSRCRSSVATASGDIRASAELYSFERQRKPFDELNNSGNMGEI